MDDFNSHYNALSLPSKLVFGGANHEPGHQFALQDSPNSSPIRRATPLHRGSPGKLKAKLATKETGLKRLGSIFGRKTKSGKGISKGLFAAAQLMHPSRGGADYCSLIDQSPPRDQTRPRTRSYDEAVSTSSISNPFGTPPRTPCTPVTPATPDMSVSSSPSPRLTASYKKRKLRNARLKSRNKTLQILGVEATAAVHAMCYQDGSESP